MSRNNCLINAPDEQVLKKFFLAKSLEGLSDKTLKSYEVTLNKLQGIKTKPFVKINIDDLRDYFFKQKSNGLKNSTINKDLKVLKTFFNFLRDEEYILIAPTLRISPAKLPRRIKSIFTDDEIQLIREGASSPRDIALIETLLSTGVRVSELVNIKISDINNNKINVIGKGDKERVVFLNSRAKKSIEDYLRERKTKSEYIFINHATGINLKANSVNWILKRIGKRQDIKKCTPHKFRRTMSSIAVRNGMSINNIRQILGHESMDTTIIYVKTDEKQLEDFHREFLGNV